jgi:hypothetical protein
MSKLTNLGSATQVTKERDYLSECDNIDATCYKFHPDACEG